jgi:hypothetical protein
MSMTAGHSLLHFRLVEKIGEGGMGEVWRALDTSLDREVAIKVLPASLGSDPERLARFEREAKVLASLNHPNIAGIHGFPEAEGRRFLAMELVRGEDLAHTLTRGPLPVREAIEAARQIAAALEAAHDRGIVHRDLKPANVKRTPEGQIKVLDFGLAKALESAAPAPAASATVTSAGSVAGMILGTASYMSPEQARGQSVDRRTDLWAFGCVLYEMLTGARAFDGPTVTDVLAAVVNGEPDWDRLPQSCPPAVRRLLRRCLEKDPRKRLRDAGDASLLLDDNPEDVRTGAIPRSPDRGRPWLLGVAIAVAIAAAAAGGGYWMASRAGGAEPAAALSFKRLTFGSGMIRAARFAPDGHTIVYGAAWDGPPIRLYLARTDTPEATPLQVPPGELYAISGKGEMAVGVGHAYYGWMGLGTLGRTPMLGGNPREMLRDVRTADWGPDGEQLAVVRRVAGMDQLEYPAGKVLDRTPGYFDGVRVSPDGERVAYADHPAWGDNLGHLAVVDRAGKKTRLAENFQGIQGVAWGPSGHEVWFTVVSERSSSILAADLQGRTRVVYPGMGWIELFDVARDGRALLGGQRPERDAVALLAGDREPRPLVIPGESSIVRALAPDGRAVLVANQVPRDYETYVLHADREGAVRLGSGESLAISADGAWALLSSADYTTFSVAPVGMGPTRTIPNPDRVSYQSIAAWLPDGRAFVVAGRQGTQPSRGFLCDVVTGACRPFGDPGIEWNVFTPPPVSPDGRRVILRDRVATAKEWPLAGGAGVAVPGLLPDDQPITYTEDGRGLFVAKRAFPIPIERLELATGRRTPWLTLAPPDRAGLRFAIPVITPDGKHWSLSTARLLTDLYVVQGLR